MTASQRRTATLVSALERIDEAARHQLLGHGVGSTRGGLALGAELFDQRVALAGDAAGLLLRLPGRLHRLGDHRIQLALRAEAERDRILRGDVDDVPMAAV